jgi:hypothetical protein
LPFIPVQILDGSGSSTTAAQRVVEAVIVGATFLIVLVVTRALGKRDLEAIKAVRRKRAAGGAEP